jgi:hypothetical protein
VLEVHEIASSLKEKYSGGLRNRCPRGKRGIGAEEVKGGCSKDNPPFSRMVLMLRY